MLFGGVPRLLKDTTVRCVFVWLYKLVFSSVYLMSVSVYSGDDSAFLIRFEDYITYGDFFSGLYSAFWPFLFYSEKNSIL